MGKQRRKDISSNHKYNHKRTEMYSSDEDAGIDMTNDNYSEISGQSDLKSNHEDAENEMQEKFEEKLMEMLDALSAKSNVARASALVALRGVLQRKPLSHLLCNHRATLADHVSRALRRGKDGERKAAAAIAPILALQIGEDGEEEYVAEVRPALVAVAADKNASLEARTECCSALAVLCYLLEDDLTEVLEVMKMYETIFSGSYLKGDGSVKSSCAETGALHAAALDGWALLRGALPAAAADALRQTPPSVAKLAGLLEAGSLDVRLAAGNALAVVHEATWSECEEGEEDEEEEGVMAATLPRLAELARESHKYRAKKDRKLQRATFRDVLKYFEEDEVSPLSVRLGAETVLLESWSGRFSYSCVCASLAGGTRALAPHSTALRRALQLSDTAPVLVGKQKMNKLQRHLQNTAVCKARTLARGKNRDKRTHTLSG